MAYLYVKAIHVIFVICWMAGLFYIVRLFIYHIEANTRERQEREILQKQFGIMERRLWNAITTPSMVITVLAGVVMLYMNPGLLGTPYMQVKIGFVIGLLAYHFICQRIMKQLRTGSCNWTSTQLRIWNEVATCLLVAIVFVIILRSALNWVYGIIGLFIFVIVIMSAVKAYKYYRSKN